MIPQARLIAVDHVRIEAPPEVREQLAWFYGDFVGLQARPPQPAPPAFPAAEPDPGATWDDGPDDTDAATPTSDAPPGELRFRGERFDLRIDLVAAPRIESVGTRVHIEIRSLEDAAGVLDDRGHPYEWMCGLQFTDRALTLLDPAGNRVLLRRMWPFRPI